MMYLVTDGHIHLRVEAETPGMAFEIAAKSMSVDKAQAHEVVFRGGVEHMSDIFYRWDGNGAIPVITDPRGVMSDPTWLDNEPSTKPFCAPIVPGKAVMIIGYGLSRCMTAHWRKDYPKAEIWTLNADRVPGATRHFQIHDPKVCPDIPSREWEHDDLIKKGITIYRHDNFPFDKMRRNYFCSTADYMLAVADAEGFETICMPGMDFAGMRRALEMHSARYWIGVLEGKGAIVRRSPFSLIFRHLTYGQHTDKEHYAFEVEPDARP